MNFFDHKDLRNHLLQLCPKVVKHPVERALKHDVLEGSADYILMHTTANISHYVSRIQCTPSSSHDRHTQVCWYSIMNIHTSANSVPRTPSLVLGVHTNYCLLCTPYLSGYQLLESEEGKVGLRTGRDSPEVEQYSSTLPSTSALDGGG